jgi:EAL domain-containing protein (putative c-di-GMP-specific phosphodiesterase class I)
VNPFQVGRRPDLALCLARRSVSNLHAEFTVEEGALFVRDLRSTNGTYVNGERISERVEVHQDDLIQFADMPFRLGCESTKSDSRTQQEDVCDRALGFVQFDKLLNERAIVSYFQPIIDLCDNRTIAYEVLSRSRLVGLETPAARFYTAAQLNLEHELSRLMRIEGVRTSTMFPEPPHIFLNTHPTELSTEGFLDMMVPLRRLATSQKITVEIHEAAVSDVSTMKKIKAGLDDLDMRLAFDDFGAGQARLCELAEVRPHCLKFDRQMIHDIHLASHDRQQMLTNLVRIVIELGVIPLAEGIECVEEASACSEMGFELAQGYHYGMPAPVTAYLLPGMTIC